MSLIPFFQTGANMNTISWSLVGFGIAFILFGVLYGIFKPKKTHSYLEMLPIMKQCEQDLPEIRKYLAQYISRVEYLADNDKRLYDLELYKEVYFKDGIKGIRKYALPIRPKEAYYWELYQREKIWKDNAVYRQVKQDDSVTNEALTKLNYYIPVLTDKKLRKYIQAIIKLSHMAYSLAIWLNFGDRLFEAKPKIKNVNLKRKESWLNFYHNMCSGASKRIDELLAGAEDT